MHCPFCGQPSYPLYNITFGTDSRVLYRCSECLACAPDAPFSELDILKSYQDSYFSSAPSEIEKGRLLALDYCEKSRIHDLLKPGLKCLEIGPGYGFFAEACRRSTGIPPDLLEPSLACRVFIRERFPDLKILGDSVESIPPDHRYDVIFAFHVVEHIQSLASFLADLHPHLSSNGRVFLLTPNAASIGFIRHGASWGWACPGEHYEFLSPFIPKDFYQKAGFDVFRCFSTRPAPIHTPSEILIRMNRYLTSTAKERALPFSVSNFLKKIIGRCFTHLVPGFRQTDPSVKLLHIERFFFRFRRANRNDELAVILQKRSKAFPE